MSKDEIDSDEIFSDNYSKNKNKENPELTRATLKPVEKPNEQKDTLDSDWEIEEKPQKTKPKRSRKNMILGAIVIGLIVGGMAFVVEVLGTDFDWFNVEIEEPTTPQTPQGSGGTNDISSASDKVELDVTDDPIGYFLVTTNGDWYGDYVDFREIPNKIQKTGTMKVNFRCYTDDFAGTSTYFGTFRNVIEDKMTVDVFIGDVKVETQTTIKNKALIVEGNCYGHE